MTDAVAELEKNGISVEQYSFPTVKPLDREVVLDCSSRFEKIFTVEEHNIAGGFGSAVAEVMAENPAKARLVRIGINDEYCTIVGSQEYLREQYGFSTDKIVKRILQEVDNG